MTLWPATFELHHGIAIGMLALAAMHAWLFPRTSKLSFETLQIMAIVLYVGAVILWFMPT